MLCGICNNLPVNASIGQNKPYNQSYTNLVDNEV